MEAEGDYIVKMIDKVLREDIRSVCIKSEAEKAFCEYTDAWMPRSICASPFRQRSLFIRLNPLLARRDQRVSLMVQGRHDGRPRLGSLARLDPSR